MRIVFEDDIPVARCSGDAQGLEHPLHLAEVPVEHLRLVDGEIVDASEVTAWHVCDRGRLHMVPAPDRQPVTCTIGDPIHLAGDGTWKVGPPVPQVVTRLQTRKALRQLGQIAAFDAWLALQPDEVQESWQFAGEVRRSHADVVAAGAGLGMSADDLDDFFRLAATL